jgi:hypothetical protein
VCSSDLVYAPTIKILKCNSNYKVKEDEMGGACSTNGENRNAYRSLVGKPEGKRPVGRSRHRWEDIIKIHFREIGWGSMDWINLAQDRDQWRVFVNMVMNLRFL